MKAIPKKHSQLNLPAGTRLRFGSTDSIWTSATICEGKPLPAGTYWVRRQHSFKPFKLKAKSIKFIDFIPGAPLPPPARKPAPPCPPPMTAVDANGRMVPIPRQQLGRIFRGGAEANRLLQQPVMIPCPSHSDWIKGTQTGRYACSGSPNLANIPPAPPAPRPAAILPAAHPHSVENISRDFTAAILRGDLDHQIEDLVELVHERAKVVRHLKKAAAVASLRKGDRVRICGKIRPAWIIGTIGVVGQVRQTKVQVIFDKPVPRFGREVNVPANCLEKI